MYPRVKKLCIALLGAGSLCAAASATGQDSLREDHCDVQARAGHDLQTVQMRDLHVLVQTSATDRFAPDLPSGAQAIVCLRSNVVPAAHDDKVLALGIPLIIVEAARPHRVGVLEINDGAFRFRMMEGTLPATEQVAIRARLEEYRARIPATAG